MSLWLSSYSCVYFQDVFSQRVTLFSVQNSYTCFIIWKRRISQRCCALIGWVISYWYYCIVYAVNCCFFKWWLLHSCWNKLSLVHYFWINTYTHINRGWLFCHGILSFIYFFVLFYFGTGLFWYILHSNHTDWKRGEQIWYVNCLEYKWHLWLVNQYDKIVGDATAPGERKRFIRR
jgi:hypothetical protein